MNEAELHKALYDSITSLEYDGIEAVKSNHKYQC